MLFEAFLRQDVANTAEALEVAAIADRLRSTLEQGAYPSLLAQANRPEASSHRIQDVLHPIMTTLGFTSERKDLFKDSISGLRPDFHRSMGASGILLEVERGKTTRNNMDLLDFWKCHICEHAHYLFLFVPILLQHNEEGPATKEFESARRRLAPFFRDRNHTNVRGLFIFGY